MIENENKNDINAVCPHFGKCGGCSYLDLKYEESLRIKEDKVRTLIGNALSAQSTPYQFDGIKPSPQIFGYRNKMEFSFGDEYLGSPLALGMHKKGSFYAIETVAGCVIADEDYSAILSHTRDFFNGLSFYHKKRHTGFLRHLLIRKAKKTSQIMVCLVTTSEEAEINASGKSVSDWCKGLLSINLSGKITGVLHLINDSVADVVRADRTELLYGRDYIDEELLGLKFKISVFSFFQTNTLGAELLYKTVREYISGDGGIDSALNGKTVFDLYSGTGTIAQTLAPAAKKVIGIEIVPEAVEAARQNAALNGLTNCEFICGDVLKALDNVEERPDFIVLDPPRDGVNPKALKKILDYGVENIIYISCKVESLARDLSLFLSAGYAVSRFVACDQFPWTKHTETVVLLTHQKKPDDFLKIHVDLDSLDTTSAETKATYERIKGYVKDKHNLRVNNLYIAQVKRDYGIIERLNYNIGDGKHHVPQCPKDKYEAIVDALRHFKMIA